MPLETRQRAEVKLPVTDVSTK